MNLIFILANVILISRASSQFAGTWLLDWQTPSSVCPPVSFEISGSNTTTYTIAYTYASQVISNNSDCAKLGITQNFTSNLTQDPNSQAFIDSHNQSLTYFEANNTIFFKYNAPQISNETLLFDQNGAYIAEEDVAASIAGSWLQPIFLNSTGSDNCSLSVIPGFFVTLPPVSGVWEPVLHYDPTNLSNSTQLSLAFASIDEPFWTTGINMTFYTSVNTTSKETTLVIQYESSGDSCYYAYQRVNNFVTGTWYVDWQSTFYTNISVTSIEITSVDDIYMNIQYNYPTYTVSSVFYQYLPDNYMSLNNTFAYNKPTNSFIVNQATVPTLFTPNGSLLSSAPFLGNWSNPQLVNNSSSDLCCLPEKIGISPGDGATSQSWLTSAFYFDQNLSPACNKNQIVSGVSYFDIIIAEPRFSQLLYSGLDGYNLTMNPDLSPLQLAVTYENDCYFVMSPEPLSANLLFNGVISFVCALALIFVI